MRKVFNEMFLRGSSLTCFFFKIKFMVLFELGKKTPHTQKFVRYVEVTNQRISNIKKKIQLI